jgi:hypothetical protein
VKFSITRKVKLPQKLEQLVDILAPTSLFPERLYGVKIVKIPAIENLKLGNLEVRN